MWFSKDDRLWLLSAQRKLHAQSREHPSYVFEKLWGLVTDLATSESIEGDIKGCFDNIGHHGLMQRVRQRLADIKLNRLALAFLKAGVLSEAQFLRAPSGTP